MEMDFHGLKRKDLQTLCKRRGIPANLKNTEMATRLASVFEKEDEETVIETKCSLEDGSIEEENLVAIRKAKRVRFSPESENEVFEFTRSVKKLKRKNVKKRSHGTAKDLQQGGNVEPRRSKRTVSTEITVGCSSSDATKAHKVPRRSKRIGSSGNIREEREETDLIALEQFEDKDIQDGLVFEKVGRRSTRLAAKSTKSCVDGGTNQRTMQSCETKTAELIMSSENVLDSTSKVSVDVSLVRNTQELNSEFMEEVLEEKHEQDTVMMTATMNYKEVASSLSELLIERPEVSIPESEIFMETTQPSSSVQSAVSNPESELGVPIGHVLVKDIAEQNIKTEEVAKAVHSFVAKLAETDAVLENSAECWNESLPSKDDERGSLEKEKQSANQHGNFSEYNTENNSAEEQGDICTVGRISAGHYVSRETLDEVTDGSQTQFVPTMFSERGSKPNALELLSTDFASLSPKEDNVSECLEEDESLMFMEQLSESGKISAADIVTQHNDKALESHEQVLLLGNYELDDVGKEKEHTATDFPDESDVHNTSQSEANGGESIAVELHDESDIAASPLRQSSVGDFKGDGIERNEEIRTVEFHCESGTCTSLNRHALSDGTESSGGSKTMEFYEESDVFTGMEERHEIFEYSGQCTDREGEVKKAAQFDEEAGLSTGMHKDSSDKSDLCMSMERRLLYGDSEQKKTVKTAEKAAAELHDESAVPNISARHPFPEESELEEAEKSEENKAKELQVDCDLFTGAEKHFEGMKGDNRIAKSNDMTNVLTASESHSLMGDFKPNEAENKYRENKDVELLSESDISTNLERHLLSGDCGLGGTREIKDSTTASCLESFVFSSAERQHHLGNSEPHTAGKEVEFPDESDVLNTSQSEAINGGESIVVELRDESNVAASPLRQSSVGDFKGDGIERNEEIRAVELHCESGTCTSLNRHALLGSFVSDGAENSGGSKAMEIYEESVVELLVDCGLFIGAEKHLLLETDEGMKGDNRISRSHDMSDVLSASESHSLTRDFEPNEAEKIYRENKDVELLSESNISTNLERQGRTREIKDGTTASCVESFVFSSPDRLLHLGNSEPHSAGKEVEFKDESALFTRLESRLLLGESEQDWLGNSEFGSSQYQIHHASSPRVILKDDNVVWGSRVSALDLGENTIADSSGSIASKVSYSHESNAGEATLSAELMPKSSQTENVAGQDATQGTSKQSRGNSPHLFDFDIEVADIIMDAERTASCSPYVLALPAKGNSETIGEITNPLKVAGTCTLVSEESRPSTNIQNQINDELVEELAITGGSSVSGKTCILGGTEEHLGCSSQEDLRNTCEKSGHRILEDEANGPIATTFVSTEKNISLTPNEFIVQDNIKKEDATQGGHSPYVTSVNLFDSDIKEERNVLLNSHVLALPAEGDSETIGEISSHLEVGGTCSMVSAEFKCSYLCLHPCKPYTDIQNQINDTLEELATNTNEADELTKAKSIKNVDSSGGSSVPGMTCVLVGTEDVHLGFTKDEANDPIATVFEKNISLTPDGFTVPNNKNEEDEEMVRREATPSPEETLNESSENREYVNTGESGRSYEKQVRREPFLIYRTQAKPKRDDMKENAPTSKIVDNLSLTAPRTSKRQPLQDLRKN